MTILIQHYVQCIKNQTKSVSPAGYDAMNVYADGAVLVVVNHVKCHNRHPAFYGAFFGDFLNLERIYLGDIPGNLQSRTPVVPCSLQPQGHQRCALRPRLVHVTNHSSRHRLDVRSSVRRMAVRTQPQLTLLFLPAREHHALAVASNKTNSFWIRRLALNSFLNDRALRCSQPYQTIYLHNQTPVFLGVSEEMLFLSWTWRCSGVYCME